LQHKRTSQIRSCGTAETSARERILLIDQLDKEGFWSRIQPDADNRVESILFAHPDSLAYLQAYPDLLLLDCTYMTNKYGVPLLDNMGINAANRSSCIALPSLAARIKMTAFGLLKVLNRSTRSAKSDFYLLS